MFLTMPITSDFNVFYFVTFYTLMYCVMYRFIYNSGIAQAQENQQKLYGSVDTLAVPSSVSEPQVEPQVEPHAELQENLDDESDEDYTPTPYNHALWPSPRPVNFVRAIIDAEPEFKVHGRRLTHAKAVDILAQRAYMTRREFLNVNPLTYSERYMRGLNALYLLKGSLDTLENTLRNETYKQELRRLENGRNLCPRY